MRVEQIVAAGAAAQNMLLAAHAMGLGAFWRTGPSAYDAGVKVGLGLVETWVPRWSDATWIGRALLSVARKSGEAFRVWRRGTDDPA